MMTTYTHEFHECGNGFPADGEDVIFDDGRVELLTEAEQDRLYRDLHHLGQIQDEDAD